MTFALNDRITFSGEELKRRFLNSVSEGDAYRLASRQARKLNPNGSLRPDMLKARATALQEKAQKSSGNEGWVREIVRAWSELTGLSPSLATFTNERGFTAAACAGRDLTVWRYVDEDGWGWAVVADSPNHWSSRTRLPESTRNYLVSRTKR